MDRAIRTTHGPRQGWWAAETPAVNEQTGTGPAGLILLHWDGSTWNKVASDMKLTSTNILTRLTPDGHGGFWPTASDPARGIVAVAGTSSLWATGELVSRKNGACKADVLRYTP